MTADQHVFDLLPAYALDCLDEDEALLVSEHLAACPECRSELRVYQAIADELPLATPMVDPPASVKKNLMDKVKADPRLVKPQSQTASWLQSLANSLRQAAPTWALAGLVLILALVSSNLLLWRQVNKLNAAYSSTAMRVVNLQGTGYVPGATGLIVISQDGDHGTLVVDHLPPLDQSEEYQLWLILNGKRTSGGVFSVDDEGYGSLWVSSPQPLVNYASFGVTIEPAGGSPGPTGEKVLGGNL